MQTVLFSEAFLKQCYRSSLTELLQHAWAAVQVFCFCFLLLCLTSKGKGLKEEKIQGSVEADVGERG